jgi:hypothetical protein
MEELENPATVSGGDSDIALAAALAVAFGAAVFASGGLFAAAVGAGFLISGL